MTHYRILCIGLSLLLYSCTDSNKHTPIVEETLQKVKMRFAPDKRVKLFAIEWETGGQNKILIQGKTTEKVALESLLDSLDERQIPYINEVRVLPDSVVGKKTYAVGKNSVINIRSNPKHSGELGTQGLLGMSLKVLDYQNDFYQVQTPDGYISWVDHGGIQRMTPAQFNDWEKKQKIIYTAISGLVYQSPLQKEIVSDIVFGGILLFLGEQNDCYKVQYPDGRLGYVSKKESMRYSDWITQDLPKATDLIRTSTTLLGRPYLWGGTSTKGMDCSGFTKTIYLMHGFVIPRDASQQVAVGETVDPNLQFEGLEVGDLLFFGKKATANQKQKVTHVGMWIGNNQFIHAAGNVHINSIVPSDPAYDAFNSSRYLGSKRYLNSEDARIIDLRAPNKIKS
ncbi:MAG: C40 family peptidase [Flavobacteriaceae bacterium]|nr:C40 family peptidase [Flavobacteriaceae bacterium]